MSRKRPVLIVDSRIEDLDSTEQGAAVAVALVAAAMSPGYWWRMVSACFIAVVLSSVIGGLAASLPGWALPMGPIAAALCTLLIVCAIQRRFSYAVDRATVKAFGWAVIDTALELHRRKPYKGLDPQRLCMPNAEQRAARLDRLRDGEIAAGPA